MILFDWKILLKLSSFFSLKKQNKTFLYFDQPSLLFCVFLTILSKSLPVLGSARLSMWVQWKVTAGQLCWKTLESRTLVCVFVCVWGGGGIGAEKIIWCFKFTVSHKLCIGLTLREHLQQRKQQLRKFLTSVHSFQSKLNTSVHAQARDLSHWELDAKA